MKAADNIAVLPVTVDVHGTCDEQFTPVLEAFRYNLNTGQDIGASVTIFVDSEAVVDLWRGHFDGTYTRPFGRDTIVQGYSSTKTITALCALVLADRGEIDLDAPAAKDWPEFAAEGKGEIVVRQVLGHTAALCGWSEPMSFRDRFDWEKSTTLLARQAPLWKPGSTSGYHGYTQGHLVGEAVRRVTGKTIGTFLSEGIARPLGVDTDYYIGTPAEADHRVSLPGAPAGARAAWWGGNDGSLSWIDLDAHMSIGFVPNRWISGSFEVARSGNIVRAAYASLGQETRGARTSFVSQES